MAGLPWFALAADFPTHPKTVRLVLRLKDHNAGMYVVRLLAFVAQHEPSGRLDGEAVEGIVEAACEWRKKPGELARALVACGFLEPHEDGGFAVHGWQERNGAHARRAVKDNARPNASRRKKADAPPPPSAGPTPDPAETPRGVSGAPRAGDVEGEGERQSGSSLRSEPEAAAAARDGREPAPEPSPPLHPVRSHELCAELRRQLARGRSSPLVPLRDDALLDRLETKLERVGLRRALEACRARAEAWRGGPEAIGSFAFFAELLLELPAAAPVNSATARALRIDSAITRAQASCPEWAGMLRQLVERAERRGLAAEVERLDRWLVPLRAARRGQVLELEAPNQFDAAFVRDNWLGPLAEALRGVGLTVEVVEPPSAAGGRA